MLPVPQRKLFSAYQRIFNGFGFAVNYGRWEKLSEAVTEKYPEPCGQLATFRLQCRGRTRVGGLF